MLPEAFAAQVIEALTREMTLLTERSPAGGRVMVADPAKDIETYSLESALESVFGAAQARMTSPGEGDQSHGQALEELIALEQFIEDNEDTLRNGWIGHLSSARPVMTCSAISGPAYGWDWSLQRASLGNYGFLILCQDPDGGYPDAAIGAWTPARDGEAMRQCLREAYAKWYELAPFPPAGGSVRRADWPLLFDILAELCGPALLWESEDDDGDSDGPARRTKPLSDKAIAWISSLSGETAETVRRVLDCSASASAWEQEEGGDGTDEAAPCPHGVVPEDPESPGHDCPRCARVLLARDCWKMPRRRR